MKTLLSLFAGHVTVTEQGGNVFLNYNASLGGGKMTGVLQGSGSIELGAMTAIQTGEVDLNAKLPVAFQPIALVIEGVINSAIQSQE